MPVEKKTVVGKQKNPKVYQKKIVRQKEKKLYKGITNKHKRVKDLMRSSFGVQSEMTWFMSNLQKVKYSVTRSLHDFLKFWKRRRQ